jgi:PAS domain S-box-containing protein
MKYKSDYSTTRKVTVSILFGVLCLLLSPFGIETPVGDINISIPWSLIFPIIAALAFGSTYGLIAGIAGGAYFPFLLWANNGLPNFGTAFFFLVIYVLLGMAHSNYFLKKITFSTKVLIILVICSAIFAVYFNLLFNYLLSLNAVLWQQAEIFSLPKDVLVSFTFKDSLNLFLLSFIALTFFQIPLIRRMLGMPEIPAMKANGLIFTAVMLGSVLIWLVFVALGYSLLKGSYVLQYHHKSLALMVMLSAGFIVSKILFYYNENQFRIRDELNRSEEKFRLIISNSNDIYVLINAQGEQFFISQAAARLTGYTVEELKVPISEVIHPDDWIIVEQLWQDVLRSKSKVVAQYRHKHKEKGYVWFEAVGQNHLDNSLINAVISNVRDITDRKKSEILLEENERQLKKQNEDYELLNKELVQTNAQLAAAKDKAEESERLKTAFLQNISHEIRTPINAICGFSSFLNRPNLPTEKLNNYVSIIQNSSNQLLSIVSDIITISSLETKQEKVTIETVYINTIIDDLMSIFQQQAKVRNISLVFKKHLPLYQSGVYTDRTKLAQILSNLIANALKFTHEGFVEVGYNIKSDEVEFFVKDSGIGVKPEQHEEIFGRFRQADDSVRIKYGGTGLGLSISKGLIELLGGRIWVQSEIGKGSIFFFTIPYKPAIIEQSLGTSLPFSNDKRTILVAEDEENNFKYINEILIGLSIGVIWAKNGEEAVSEFKTTQKIDLVLMDIQMPKMDGHTAAKIIKKLNPNIPIIAQSAFALEHEIDKYSQVFDDYLVKPISPAKLIEALGKYIEFK